MSRVTASISPMSRFVREINTKQSTGLPLQTRGSIVNVGSILSHLAIPGINPYVMAKHGVLGLTKADAMDYAKHGIRINCLVPGWIQTAMTAALREDAALVGVLLLQLELLSFESRSSLDAIIFSYLQCIERQTRCEAADGKMGLTRGGSVYGELFAE